MEDVGWDSDGVVELVDAEPVLGFLGAVGLATSPLVAVADADVGAGADAGVVALE